jgi:thiol peroxidase
MPTVRRVSDAGRNVPGGSIHKTKEIFSMSERKGLVTFKGNPITLRGKKQAKVGAKAPAFQTVATDLSVKGLTDYAGKVVILSVVPSLDTGVCDTMTRRFNVEAGKLGDQAAVLTISRDLPFAQKRWCGAADAKNIVALSDFRNRSFGQNYGLEIGDGPLAGLLTRAVLVVDKEGTVAYEEIVKEVTTEPNYDAAIEAAKKLA